MECFLHVAYKFEIKKWRVCGAVDKQAVKEKKIEIQLKLMEELGLVIDMSNANVFGTSNDGNTAHCFFRESEKNIKHYWSTKSYS